MPQISTREFERLPLRVHDLLAGVPLHDVWAVELPWPRSGITLDEFSRAANARVFTPSPIVRALVRVRLLVGRLLGWDREPAARRWESFATRLTTADLSKSRTPAGTREGLFRVPFRERAAPRADQSHRPRGGDERPRRDGRRVPLLLRRLRAQGQPLHAGLHGPHRSIPEADRLSVAPALRPRELEPNHRTTSCTWGAATEPRSSGLRR